MTMWRQHSFLRHPAVMQMVGLLLLLPSGDLFGRCGLLLLQPLLHICLSRRRFAMILLHFVLKIPKTVPYFFLGPLGRLVETVL